MILLCVLLVYAPEIFTAVSAPYKAEQAVRSLLRVVLCTQDAKAASSFYQALNGFRKSNPSVHLRVQRVDEAQLRALPDPLPDVYVSSEGIELDPAGFIRFSSSSEEGASAPHLLPFSPEEGEMLLCGVRSNAPAQAAAVDLVSYLYAQQQPASGGGD